MVPREDWGDFENGAGPLNLDRELARYGTG